MTQLNKPKLHFRLKLLFISILAVMAIALERAPKGIAAAKHTSSWDLLRIALLWVENLGDFQPIAFILIYNVATVLFVPGVVLNMSGGVLLGVVWGSIYVAIATALGATVAFLFGRYLCRDMFWQMIQDRPKFMALDVALKSFYPDYRFYWDANN